MQEYSTRVDTDALYSDEDIRILHDIVRRAQQSHHSDHPDRPLKSLLSAHDHVLAEHEKHLSRDAKYFDFILDNGSELGKNGTQHLVGRFLTVLEQRYGIELQVYDDHVDQQPTSHNEFHAPSRGRPRRASFNDSRLEETWMSGRDLYGRHADVSHAGRQRDPRAGGRAKRSRSTSARPMIGHMADQRAGPPLDSQPRQPGYSRHLKEQLRQAASIMHATTVSRRVLNWWRYHARTQKQHHDRLWALAVKHDKQDLLRQSFGALSETQYWAQQDRKAQHARNMFLLTKAFTHWAQVVREEAARVELSRRHVLRMRYFGIWRHRVLEDDRAVRSFHLQKAFRVWQTSTNESFELERRAEIFRKRASLSRSYWHWFWAFCDRRAPLWRNSTLETKYLVKLSSAHRLRKEQDTMAAYTHRRTLKHKALSCLLSRYRSVKLLHSHADMHHQRHLLSASLGDMRVQTKLQPLQDRVHALQDRRILARSLVVWRWVAHLSRQAMTVEQQRMLRHAWTQWNDTMRVRALELRTNERVAAHALFQWLVHARMLLFRRILDQRLVGRALRALREIHHARSAQLSELYIRVRDAQDRRVGRAAMTCLHAKSRSIEHIEQSAQENLRATARNHALTAVQRQVTHQSKLKRWAENANFYRLTNKTLKRWHDATKISQRTRRHRAFEVVRQSRKQAVKLQSLQEWRSKLMGIRNMTTQATEMSRSRLHDTFRTWHTKARLYRAARGSVKLVSTSREQLVILHLVKAKAQIVHAREQSANDFIAERVERIAARMLKKLSLNAESLRFDHVKADARQSRNYEQHRRLMFRHWQDQASRRRQSRYLGDPDSPSRRGSAANSGHVNGVSESSNVPIDSVTGTVDGESMDKIPGTAVGETLDPSRVGFATPLPGYLRTPSKRTARSKARFKGASMGSSLLQQSFSTAAATTDMERNRLFGNSVMSTTTPAPLSLSGNLLDMDTLTPQVTPFERKLRAGGYQDGRTPAFGRSIFGNSVSGANVDEPRPPELGRSRLR